MVALLFKYTVNVVVLRLFPLTNTLLLLSVEK